MRKIKRSVIVKGVRHPIWLGIVKKRYNNSTVFNLYFYPGDANHPENKPEPLKNGFKSEKEAIQYGIDYMYHLIKDIMERSK